MTQGKFAYLQKVVVLVAIIGLLLTVSWLFIKADQVSPEQHYRYLRTLRHVQDADVSLNFSVVAAYAGLLQNYDPLVRYGDEIRRHTALLQNMPESMTSGERQQLEEKIREMQASQKHKEDIVDRFQRAHSILRNSESYFPKLAEDALALQKSSGNLAIDRFVRRMLAFASNSGVDDRASLLVELEGLRTSLSYGPHQKVFGPLLVHAGLILDQRLAVESLVTDIATLPTMRRADELTRRYVGAYERGQQQAATYRGMLYAITLMLVIYVIYAVFRMRADAQTLAIAHANLAERYEAQRQAEAELTLYANVFSNAAEGMIITDEKAVIVAVNPTFSRITGFSQEEAIGQTPALLASGRQDKAFYSGLWEALQATGQWQGEIWNRRKEGGIYPEWLSISAVYDPKGAVSHYIGVFQDISERKQNEARIHHLAHHDALTGLPNRLLLEDRLNQGLLKSKRSHRPMAVVFIDLDRFKNINDTLGHDIGDRLLIQAAQRGLAVLRDTDTLSRQGGDEFVAILPELENRQSAMHIARKLLATLAQPYLLAGHELTVSGSAGVALYPADGETASELLRKADAAMYRAKEEGSNTFRFFSAEVNTASLGELLLENELRAALERDELLMYYQSKVDARSGQLVGAEALMRWRHREHGMIPPCRFIPLAEASGQIERFGQWAIESVCAQQRTWLDAKLHVVPVAVNIAAKQFADPAFPKLVQRCLNDHSLPPELLELELTESMLMRNSRHAIDVLNALHEMRVKVSIDDFGTGYSSLSYLKQFPVNGLKIDRSFVCEIDEAGERVKLASAIIAMAHELEMQVIAEGVENEAQRRYLRDHGCDFLQGFLFGQAIPAEIFRQLLETQEKKLLAS